MIKIPSKELPRFSPDDYVLAPKMPVIVCLDNVRSAYNVGAILRCCDVFHVEKIVLGGYTPLPTNYKVWKTSLGAEKTVKWEFYEQISSYLGDLKKSSSNVNICIIEHTRKSLHLSSFNPQPSDKYVLVFGNELFGISDEVINQGDIFLEIDQKGTKHSLNVAVCAGITLWYFFVKLWKNRLDG